MSSAITDPLQKINNFIAETITTPLDLSQIPAYLKNYGNAMQTSRSLTEKMRFIHLIGTLKQQFQDKESLHIFQECEKTAAFALCQLSSVDPKSYQFAVDLKQANQELYYQAVADWINLQDIPLFKFDFHEDEIRFIAPFLRKVRVAKQSKSFLDALLRYATKLESLHIEKMSVGDVLQKNAINLPFLKHLTISECQDFNELIAVNSLSTVKIFCCPNFNQPLDTLINLEELEIFDCCFNHPIRNLCHLKNLSISKCSEFSSSIHNLKNLQELEISCCHSFNQTIDCLPSLKSLEIYQCGKFAQILENLDSLQSLFVDECPGFPYLLQPFSIILLLSDYARKYLGPQKDLDKASSDHLQAKILSGIENLYKNHQFKENLPFVAELLYFSKADTETLSKMFPEYSNELLLHIIRHSTEDSSTKVLLKDLFKLQEFAIAFDAMVAKHPLVLKKALQFPKIFAECKQILQLSRETLIELLPTLGSNDVKIVLNQFSSKEKKQWLDEEIAIGPYKGKFQKIFAKASDIITNTQGGAEEEINSVLAQASSFPHKNIKTLAALAEKKPKITLPFLQTMTDQQLAAVIPVIEKAQFVKYLQQLPPQKIITYIDFMASDQKLLFFKTYPWEKIEKQKAQYIHEKRFRIKLLQKLATENTEVELQRLIEENIAKLQREDWTP